MCRRGRLLAVVKQQLKPVSSNKLVSWRRHSMRKTRPIMLPKPADTVPAGPHHDYPSSSTTSQRPLLLNKLSANVTTSTCTLSHAISHDSLANELSSPNDIDDDHEYTNNSTIRSRSHLRHTIPQAIGPQSLQTDEILNTLDVTAASNSTAQLLFNLDYIDDVDSRPRQMGRRSEPRNRIVSITAERSLEGDQVR